MRYRSSLLGCLLFAIVATGGYGFFRAQAPGVKISEKGAAFVETLTAEQKKTVLHDFDDEKRIGWHFIPKEYRKGLQIKHMDDKQRKAAHELLSSTLSKLGYDKAKQIMQLEYILHQLEEAKGTRRFPRDTERYYFSVFGTPSEKGKWGLSIEGHHLSLNFTIDEGKVTSSTPTFLAANPATVKSEVEGGLPMGTRVLKNEEQLAFDFVNALSAEQKKKAIVADKAPKEIRAAGEPQPPKDEKLGIAVSDLEGKQKQALRTIVNSYAENLPEPIRAARMNAIAEAGPDKIHFAWAGATKPGVGHYYRIQGPTFLIEFVNTQPDPAGNIANHIHCVWRDMKGDFAIPLAN